METFYSVTIARKDDEALIESLSAYDRGALRKGIYTPSEPFEMKIDEGSKLFDIVGFQDTSNFAISARLYSLLTENNITGWKGYEIRIAGVHEKFYGFQVMGRCGKLEESETAGFSIGYKFDQATWDRSDFFSPESTALLFCVQKVRDLMKKNKITNVDLTDISKVQNFSF